jgi:exopolyphosphatase/guanosine-5'-triphosphate,3'-diphosphate pyrophosphatase
VRIAGIDIGTNTVLLLVADVDERGALSPVLNEQRIPRLGRDVDRKKQIHPSAFDRIGWVVSEFKNLAVQLKAERITACATSAVRDAANRDEFLRHLRSTTGIGVEVLPGEDEAYWSYRGAMSGISSVPRPVVLDIGGGSTEVSFLPPAPGGSGRNSLRYLSFQLGSVRLTERYLQHDPPTEEEINSVRMEIESRWDGMEDLDGGVYTLVGVAGTVTTLACLDQGLSEFDESRVGGYRLSREHVDRWSGRFSGMKKAEIEALSNATAGRADILTAGVLILSEFMRRYRFNDILVSTRGLRYGLVLREWERLAASK